MTPAASRAVRAISGPWAWTVYADLADAATRAVTDTNTLTGITAPFSASVSLDLGVVADILTLLIGSTISCVTVGDDEWKIAVVSRGLSPVVAEFSLRMFQAACRGTHTIAHMFQRQVTGTANGRRQNGLLVLPVIG